MTRGFRTVVAPDANVRELKLLVDSWQEKSAGRRNGLVCVRSLNIVPDSSNRSHTGLSVDHIHFIASNILSRGFAAHEIGSSVASRKKRRPHDVPVLVRGSLACPIAAASLEIWERTVAENPKCFPRSVDASATTVFFTSLGNGHFTQALNLFQRRLRSKFAASPFVPPAGDAALRKALDEGVPSIILRQETPIEIRRRIAKLLNDTHFYKWTVLEEDGSMDISPQSCYLERFNQFEAQAKVADAEALSALVQLEMGTFHQQDDEDEEKKKAAQPRPRL